MSRREDRRDYGDRSNRYRDSGRRDDRYGRDRGGRGRGDRGPYQTGGRGRGGGPRDKANHAPSDDRTVVTNYYQCKMDSFVVFEYSAEVIDPVPKEGRTHTPRFVKVVVQRMLEQHETALGYVVDDGPVIYAVNDLGLEVKFVVNLGRSSATVVLTYSGERKIEDGAPLDPQAVRFLELFSAKQVVEKKDFVTGKGLTMYEPGKEQKLCGNLLTVATAFAMKWRHREGKTLLNMDLRYLQFSTGGDLLTFVLEAARDARQRVRSFDEGNRDSVIEAFEDLRRNSSKFFNYFLKSSLNDFVFEATHLKSIKRKIARINMKKTASNHEFDRDGKKVTVEDHFKEKGLSVAYADKWPLVEVKRGATINYFPLQYCRLIHGPGIVSDARSRSKVVEATTKLAGAKIDEINDLVGKLPHLGVPGKIDIYIGDQPLEVPAVVLHPPTLAHGAGRVNVNRGSWRLDAKFVHPQRDVDLAIVSQLPERDLRRFIGSLHQFGKEKGMSFREIPVYDSRMEPECIISILKREQRDNRVFIVIVKDDLDAERYTKVKRFGEVENCVPTQFIRERTVHGCNPGIYSQLLMAINVKLPPPHYDAPGENCMVDQLSTNMATCFIGVDINHSTRADRPSDAALAASYNINANAYFSATRAVNCIPNGGVRDFCQPISEMMSEFLDFLVQAGIQPFERYVFIRDGLAESQFANYAKDEMQMVEDIIFKFYKDRGVPLPKITFIVGQKKNSTRFATLENGEKKTPAPGTVVSRIITMGDRDFFLVSYDALKGCPRPMYFHILRDDANSDTRDIAQMMYNLCHLHQGCTKAVRMPAPVLYAHKVAYRVGEIYRVAEMYSSEHMSVVSTESQAFPAITLDKKIRSTAFYL